jgi:16S rRNA (cytosine1402-N4)-methyltransferase
MNRRGDDPTVAELVADADEAELARIFWEYGQDRFSRRIAKRIAEFKSRGGRVETTGQLVRLVEEAVPRAAWPRDIHVATKVFQALRIRVNNELEQLQNGLNAAIDNLAPGGRVVVISFHSLEDSIVKSTFARRAGKAPGASGYSPAALMPDRDDAEPELRILTRKPVVPDELEKRANVRSRSAKLRAAERIA